MKRLVIAGLRQAVFEEVEMPVCAADGVVVKAKVTAISAGTEVRVYRAIAVDEAGSFMHETVLFELPIENGYSMVGEVVEVGAKVEGLAVGNGCSPRCRTRNMPLLPPLILSGCPRRYPMKKLLC